MKRFACSVLLLTLLELSAPGARADFATGMFAYEQGNFVEAFEEFRPLADQGNADAQYRLGLMYEHGRGVDQDYAEAAEWYRRAALSEHPQARTNLGSLYYHGHGVDRDLTEALRWYTMAADQNRAVAQNNLGRMYEDGEGIPADPARAAEYYRLAADQGSAEGQYALARLFQTGKGVPQNDGRAARLLIKAAKQDHADAQNQLARLYAEGRGVKQNPTKASNWYRAAAANGSAEAQRDLDAFYASRGDLPTGPLSVQAKDGLPPTAVGKATSTATPPVSAPATVGRGDDVAAQRPAASVGTAPDPPAARQHSQTAPPLPGSRSIEGPEGLYQRGRQYARGIGVPKDEREAIRWYREAAEAGHHLAGYRVALLYLRGRGVDQPDMEQAHFWFSVSAERGVGDAADWRDRIAKKLTRRQREESARLFAEYLARAGS